MTTALTGTWTMVHNSLALSNALGHRLLKVRCTVTMDMNVPNHLAVHHRVQLCRRLLHLSTSSAANKLRHVRSGSTLAE